MVIGDEAIELSLHQLASLFRLSCIPGALDLIDLRLCHSGLYFRIVPAQL